MPAARPKPAAIEEPSVEAKLLDGHYDRLLDDFQQTLDEAAATLRRAYEAMRAENTLRS
ncbi:hypothetical protein [Phenylobacterium sp.]|uniref:hypothetical protein n=1 Tax=Phenylobacterium sp. TaxID=1871053 RepID=UPI0025F8CA20|nr:hypothetical protein [Phenylobacterium sp.]